AHRVRPEAGSGRDRAAGVGTGSRGLCAVGSLTPRGRRRPSADRAALAIHDDSARTGWERAGRRGSVGCESRRVAGTPRSHDALAGAARVPRRGRGARGAARPHRVMSLTATTFPGLDPLLQSGVIAVVRLTEAVRLGAAA